MTYNLQIVVDNRHKLIVDTDITSQGNDVKQLHTTKATKDKASSENALVMFTYNLKRVLNITGVGLFKKLIVAIGNWDIQHINRDIEEYILFSRLFIGFFWNFFIRGIYQKKLKILVR